MEKRTALIIGGTSGFGVALTETYAASGVCDTITLGRSGGDYRCDVENEEEFKATLLEIRQRHPLIDSVVCVVGYARYTQGCTADELLRTQWLNYGYVVEAWKLFSGNLQDSGGYGSFVTIGSRWSYLRGEPLLEPYINAKHELCAWVRGRNAQAEYPVYPFFHYCVPTMDTPQYALVAASAQALGKTVTGASLADPKVVARAIVQHSIAAGSSIYDGVYVVDPSGDVLRLG